MKKSLPVLGNVRVASPCTESWESMQAVDGDRVRHCGRCELDVYNLSAMTQGEAEAFVAERLGAGRTCVQFFQRKDGTMLTRDCPVGWKRVQRRMAFAAAAVVSFLGLGAVTAFAGTWTVTCHTSNTVDPMKSPLLQRLAAMFMAKPAPQPPRMVKGEMVYIPAGPIAPSTPAPASTP